MPIPWSSLNGIRLRTAKFRRERPEEGTEPARFGAEGSLYLGIRFVVFSSFFCNGCFRKITIGQPCGDYL